MGRHGVVGMDGLLVQLRSGAGHVRCRNHHLQIGGQMGSLALSPIGWAIAITVAGGLGAVLRLLLSRWHRPLPWGILAANSIAAFLLGLFLYLDHSQFLVISALAGGLSTFSTFAGQTAALWSAGQRIRAGANFALNFALPYTGVLFGALLSASLLK